MNEELEISELPEIPSEGVEALDLSGVNDALSAVSVDESSFELCLSVLWSLEVTLIFIFAILVLIAGLLMGSMITRKWHA